MANAIYEILAGIATVVGPHQDASASFDPWLRARQRLESSLQGKLKVEDMARQMGLSTEHFIRLFKKRFSLSPKAYHMRSKMQEAARALRAGTQSIKTVGYNLGFSDPKSFARRFKHCLGVTPSDLRSSTSSVCDETIVPPKQAFPMNIHLVPPTPNWSGYDRYLPKPRRTESTLADSEAILDKMRHPEHYV